ncbi:hypothetical protein GH714_006141 [Hevea brasiliensis]|uniref:H(+)-exporting diphosphatase n=1 Tax=Hevea brasiliensis TaxID=3981 RepID=A0A6A6NFY4_HEVBR|nr:hypothetical protein GH714_006141 [Hevea brasiliensis]
MLTPLIAGTFFGVETLAGVLAGSLVSGVQYALIILFPPTELCYTSTNFVPNIRSPSQLPTLEGHGTTPRNTLRPHKAAVIGDTIGDPLKDTSGPSLNILIKLMAVESLVVFAPFLLLMVACCSNCSESYPLNK